LGSIVLLFFLETAECLVYFCNRLLAVAKYNVKVLHEPDHDIVERPSIDEVDGFDHLRPEDVWAHCHSDVIVVHLVVFFKLDYGS